MRVVILQREKAAFIKLRRLGYTIPTIAKAFGRSTSVIYRYLRKALNYHTIPYWDLRKIPNKHRQISKTQRWKTLMRWLPLWEKWILGEGERPP